MRTNVDYELVIKEKDSLILKLIDSVSTAQAEKYQLEDELAEAKKIISALSKKIESMSEDMDDILNLDFPLIVKWKF